MTDPTYQRTTGQRNKLNKRVYRPIQLGDRTEVTSDRRCYMVGKDGARRRVENK